MATRAKGGCIRRCYEHGTLQDLQRWQKFFVEAVCIVNTIMLVGCAAFLAAGYIVGWGVAVPLMQCPYCQYTDAHFCQPQRSGRLSQPPGVGSVANGT